MEIFEKKDGCMPYIELVGVDRLDIQKTFDCGQCFRFDRVEGSSLECEYAGVAFGKHVSFASEGERIYIFNSDKRDFERIWMPFLALDMDYAQIDGDILSYAAGTVMDAACEHGRGIRILRQDPYEATVSFIISQNNNIPRIKKIIEAMSSACGERIDMSEQAMKHTSGVSSLCAFPTCEALVLLGEQGLFDLKTGFRAKYIYDAVTKISKKELMLEDVSACEKTDECIERLCAVKGIGLKVASCIALFGMGRYDAFPIDVWMKRVAEKYFSEGAEEFTSARFGRYAGIAQQYLFYYERYLGGE